jgi:hypothetical protein
MTAENVINRRTFTTRFVITTAILAALAGLIGATIYHMKKQAGDEDRPQIIVRSGSVDFEHAKKWKYKTTGIKTEALTQHGRGKHVKGYEVTFDPPSGLDGTPSNPCPSTGITGTSVDIQYKPAVGVSQHLIIATVLKSGSKYEPLITAPGDMDIDAGQTHLTYGASSGGKIESVTVTGKSGFQTCRPPTSGSITAVYVQPF